MPNTAEFDVIIFGATGYTGKIVVTEYVKLYPNSTQTFAIAGRNQQKLQDVLQWVSGKVGQDITSTATVIANVEDEESIVAMARRARVIINCCGPFRLYGEVVVKACVENGTHHVDVSGEPEYMESMQLRYHDIAERNGAYVVNACGFDSVPADFGVIHLTKNFPGVVNSIESYLLASSKSKSGPSINVGTWESIVHSVANRKNLIEIRKKFLSLTKRPKLQPRLKSRSVVHKSEVFDNKYSVPFPGADKSVVFRTQTFLYNKYKLRPIQYNPYFICANLMVLFGLSVMGSVLLALCQFGLGRRLLLRYPKFFTLGMISAEGPSEESRLSSSVRFRFTGSGWTQDIADQFEDKTEINVPPNKKIQTEVYSKDMGYGFTARAVILSSSTILNESEKMPSKGGVYTPGSAFYETSYFDKIQQQGISFEVISKDK